MSRDRRRIADVLSHWPDYKLDNITNRSSSVTDLIFMAYAKDDQYVALPRALGGNELEDSDTDCRYAYVKGYIRNLMIKTCCVIDKC